MNFETILNNLGLSKNEAKIYLAALEMGISSAQDIARKAGIIRTTGYSILEQLVQKKLIHRTKEKNKTRYIAEDPKNLNKRFEEYQKELEKKLPELQAIYNRQEVKPQIRFYQGIEGIKQVFEETLKLERGSETLAYASGEITHKYLDEYIEDYMRRRRTKGISQRAIVEKSPWTENLQKRDKKDLRNMILVNKKDFPFKDQINIFGNKMFIASFEDLIAVIIESGPVVETQKAVFELAWIGAQKVGIKSSDPYIPKKK